jgi:cytochrome c oxidase subunit 2
MEEKKNNLIFVPLIIILTVAIFGIVIFVVTLTPAKQKSTNTTINKQTSQIYSTSTTILTTQNQQIKKITITAQQWSYDPNTITVNEKDKVILSITSKDIEHNFSLPDFGINEILSPGKTIAVEFIANKKGTFTFSCGTSCGPEHSDMKGTLIVE